MMNLKVNMILFCLKYYDSVCICDNTIGCKVIYFFNPSVSVAGGPALPISCLKCLHSGSSLSHVLWCIGVTDDNIIKEAISACHLLAVYQYLFMFCVTEPQWRVYTLFQGYAGRQV